MTVTAVDMGRATMACVTAPTVTVDITVKYYQVSVGVYHCCCWCCCCWCWCWCCCCWQNVNHASTLALGCRFRYLHLPSTFTSVLCNCLHYIVYYAVISQSFKKILYRINLRKIVLVFIYDFLLASLWLSVFFAYRSSSICSRLLPLSSPSPWNLC